MPSFSLTTPFLWLIGILAALILLKLIPMPEAAASAAKRRTHQPKSPDCTPTAPARCPDCAAAQVSDTATRPPQNLLAWVFTGDNSLKLIALAAVVMFGIWKEGTAMTKVLAALAGGPASPQDILTLSLFGAVIMTSIAGLPVASFIVRGWNIKKSDIMSSLGDKSIKLYVKTFLKKERADAPSIKNDLAIFDEMYLRRYGRYRLREPLILLVVTLFPLSLLMSHTALARLAALSGTPIPTGSLILPGEALAAVAGAYTFVIAALVRSAMNYELPPLMLANAALRLLVAAPVGYAVAAFDGTKSEFIAFAIGAFPIDQVQTIFGRLTSKYFNTSDNDPVTADSTDKTMALDGVDQPMAENLAAGEITTAVQLAYCDPVQLSLRTNIDFDVILDLQSEALAYIYLGGQLDMIRPLGLRGAVEISNLMNSETIPARPGQPTSDFTQAFTSAQVASKIDAGGLRNCFNEITKDPYTIFLVESWACRNSENGSNA